MRNLSLSCLSLILLLKLVARATATSTQQWQLVHRQSDQYQGSSTQPSIRYGHSCIAHKGRMLMTHGYFYDRVNSQATWLSDTWSMSMSSPFAWTKLNPGISQDHAHSAYSSGRVPPAPCGRFGHTEAVVNDTLYVLDGHDGGVSRHGKQNYEPGYDFDELWAMDFKTSRWQLVQPSPHSKVSPGKRYLVAATAVGDQLLAYGGLAEGQGDVWAFDLVKHVWRQLHADEPRSASSPGRRVGHSLFPVDFPQGPKGFILYGGRYIDSAGTSQLDSQAWFFDLSTNTWRPLAAEPAPGTTTGVLAARKYHMAAHTYLPVHDARDANRKKGSTMEPASVVFVGFVGAGTVTTPGLKCAADAWAFTLDCKVTKMTWHRLPDMPLAVYDGKGAASAAGLFAFGGHLCSDTKGDLPYYYVNTVSKLDLAPFIATLTSSAKAACPLDAVKQKEALPHVFETWQDAPAHSEL